MKEIDAELKEFNLKIGLSDGLFWKIISVKISVLDEDLDVVSRCLKVVD